MLSYSNWSILWKRVVLCLPKIGSMMSFWSHSLILGFGTSVSMFNLCCLKYFLFWEQLWSNRWFYCFIISYLLSIGLKKPSVFENLGEIIVVLDLYCPLICDEKFLLCLPETAWASWLISRLDGPLGWIVARESLLFLNFKMADFSIRAKCPLGSLSFLRMSLSFSLSVLLSWWICLFVTTGSSNFKIFSCLLNPEW